MKAIELTILAAIAEAEAVVAKKPKPMKGLRLALAEWQDERTMGPLYIPAELFGDGQPLPERERSLILRHVHRMSEAGLLDTFGVNRRLRHVRTTALGKAALAEATAADTPLSPVTAEADADE